VVTNGAAIAADLANPLADLQRPPAYRINRTNLFASDDSLNWFIRMNRAVLIDAGALLSIAGKGWIVPDKFDACVLSIGATRVRQ
jgi:hypothetical protein